MGDCDGGMPPEQHLSVDNEFFCQGNKLAVFPACHSSETNKAEKVMLIVPGSGGWDSEVDSYKNKLIPHLTAAGVTVVGMEVKNSNYCRFYDCEKCDGDQPKAPCGYERDVEAAMVSLTKNHTLISKNAKFIIYGHSMGSKAVSNLTDYVNHSTSVVGRVLSHGGLCTGTDPECPKDATLDPKIYQSAKPTLLLTDVRDTASGRRDMAIVNYCCNTPAANVAYVETAVGRLWDPHGGYLRDSYVTRPLADWVNCVLETPGAGASCTTKYLYPAVSNAGSIKHVVREGNQMEGGSYLEHICTSLLNKEAYNRKTCAVPQSPCEKK